MSCLSPGGTKDNELIIADEDTNLYKTKTVINIEYMDLMVEST